jgi:hypothetical protein
MLLFIEWSESSATDAGGEGDVGAKSLLAGMPWRNGVSLRCASRDSIACKIASLRTVSVRFPLALFISFLKEITSLSLHTAAFSQPVFRESLL